MPDDKKFKLAKVKILPDIPIPQGYRRSFKAAVEILATDANVPVALIMRLDRNRIEVFSTNTHLENQYSVGDSEILPKGLYCETVIKTGKCLMVPNAKKDKKWQDNPDVELNMIAYMGLPLYWPSGEVFGTVCLLNTKEHHFTYQELQFIRAVRDAIETDLAKIHKQYCEENEKTPQAVEITVASRL